MILLVSGSSGPSLCLSSRERFDSLVESENASEGVEEEVVRTGKENGVAADQVRVCDWCNVMCNTQMDFDSHHAATLRKHVPLVKKEVAVV